MQEFKKDTMLALYKDAVDVLLNNPEQVRAPRGQKIHEIIGAHIELTDPNACLWSGGDKTRPYPLQYLKDELAAYLSCKDDLDIFGKISKFWYQLSDDGETVNSSYGKIIYETKHSNKEFAGIEKDLTEFKDHFLAWRDKVSTQYEWVIESFEKDKDTRQAIMFVASPYYQYKGNRDFICTLNYHFIIDQDNKLNMIVNRRSQDIHFGMTFDIPWEVMVQNIVLHDVQKMYPEVTMGSYMLNCNSLHMYERNFDIYKDFCNDETLVARRLPAIKGNYFKDRDITASILGGDVDSNEVNKDEFKKWVLN